MSFTNVQFTSDDREAIQGRLLAWAVRTNVHGRMTYASSFVGDETFTIGQALTSASFEAEIEPSGVTVAHTDGPTHWTCSKSEGDLRAETVLFGAHRTFKTYSRRGNTSTSVTFESSRLSALMRAYFGSDVKAQLRQAHPAQPMDDRRWRQLTGLVRSSRIDQPLIRANAYRALAFTMLDSFTVTQDRQRSAALASQRSRSFTRAAEFIDVYASNAIGIDDVATEVGVTVQELSRLFLVFSPLGNTPQQYLQLRRLERAHQELLRADPDTTSVPAIAMKWGFATTATFVRLHLQQYGTPPHALLE